MKNIWAFNQGDAKTLSDRARKVEPRAKIGNVTEIERESKLQIAQATSEIAAATDGQLVQATVQLVTFDPSSSPASMTDTDLATKVVWNPHEDAFPADTYLIIGKVPKGWIIIAPLNYCP